MVKFSIKNLSLGGRLFLAGLLVLGIGWAILSVFAQHILVWRLEQQVVPLFGGPAVPRDGALDGRRVSVKWEPSAFEGLGAVDHWLSTHGVKLKILIVPSRSQMMEFGQESLTGAIARELAQRGLDVLDSGLLFERFYRAAGAAPIFLDETHLGLAGQLLVRRIVDEALSKLDAEKRVVLAGDCTVEGVAWCRPVSIAVRLGLASASMERIDLMYREGRANAIGANLVLYDEDFWKTHPLVIWVLHDYYFSAKPSLGRFSIPRSDSAKARVDVQMMEARVLRVSQFDQGRLRGSPYPDALLAIQYKDVASGDRFTGIHQLMAGHRILEASDIVPGDTVRMCRQDWIYAQRMQPALAKTQILDDTTDFEQTVFWVEEWAKVWSSIQK